MIATLSLAVLLALLSAGTGFAMHARPGSSTPLRVPLVPAFAPCFVANSAHVAPLEYPSCTPAQTQGDLSALSNAGAGSGFLTLSVICTDGQVPDCNPSDGIDREDVRLEMALTDVVCLKVAPGCPAAGADYNDEFFAAARFRITDHSSPARCGNGRGAPPCVSATLLDIRLSLGRGQCVDNGGAGGGTCNLSTTLSTYFPGVVKDGQRGVLQMVTGVGTFGEPLPVLEIANAGEDGDLGPVCPPLCGTGDEEPIGVEGVFAP